MQCQQNFRALNEIQVFHSALCFDVRRTTHTRRCSPQLTILTPSAVIPTELLLLLIFLLLTRHAQAHARNRFLPSFRNTRLAMLAMGEAWAARQAALRTIHAVLHRCVDLILYCAVAGPTGSHRDSSLT